MVFRVLPLIMIVFSFGAIVTEPALALSPQAFLKQMQGSWRGSGFLIKRSSGEQQTALCKITTTAMSSGIKNTGRCAANNAGGDVQGTLRYTGGRFVGSFLDPGTQTRKPATGRLSGDTLTLRRTESREGQSVRVTATIEMFNKDRYRVNVAERVGGKTSTVLRLTFRRL